MADLGLAVGLAGPRGGAQLSQIRGTPNFVSPEGWQVRQKSGQKYVKHSVRTA